MFKSRKKILLIVAAAGICVKAVEFMLWRASAFRFYNFVPGLDMETLLRFSEWGTPGNGFFLTPHRALIAAWWALNGHTHFVPGIVAVQSLFGVLGAVLCADLALKFCDRDRVAALVCGGLYLLYGPFFIYEFSVLQEPIALNLILLAFHAAVSARSGRGFLWAGLALGLGAVGRPTAVLFVPAMLAFMAYREFSARRRGRSETAKRLLALVGGLLAVPCLVSIANRIFGGNWNCFFNVLPYSLEFNAAPAAAAPAAGALPPLAQSILNALCRAPRMFMPTEIPENLNYCFLCKLIPVLRILPGPGLLLPLAIAGMLLLVPKLRKSPAAVLLPIVTLVFPLCVREPVGRYRLTLIPYFILCAAYWFHVLRSRPKARKLPAALAAVCFAAALLLPSYRNDLLRSDDYLTHTLALEIPNGKRPTAESIGFLAEGWMKGHFRNNRLGIGLYHRLVAIGDEASARRILLQGAASSPDNGVYLYYLARDAEKRNEVNPRREPPDRRPEGVSAPSAPGASGTAPAPPAAPSRE